MHATEALQTIETIKRQCLIDYGFTIGERDARFHTAHAGRFMVVESFSDASLPCADGATSDTWGIVGDNLSELIDCAFDYLAGCDA